MTSFNFFNTFSVLLEGSIIGFLFFLISIKNLSNDIVSLVKQKHVQCSCLCIYIIGTWIGDLQIWVKVPFLISCIGKIDKLFKVLVIGYEHRVLKTTIYVI